MGGKVLQGNKPIGCMYLYVHACIYTCIYREKERMNKTE